MKTSCQYIFLIITLISIALIFGEFFKVVDNTEKKCGHINKKGNSLNQGGHTEVAVHLPEIKSVLKAIASNNKELLQDLLSRDPSLINYKSSYDQSSLLHFAVQHHASLGIVLFLIANGVEPNCVDDLRKTPLHYAFEFGAPANLISALQDKGADPNLADVYGKRPRDCVP